MSYLLPHPASDQIELAAVLEALSDPTRLGIVIELADRKTEWEARCGEFSHLGSKTNLTYHFAKLRAAGVTHARAEGTLTRASPGCSILSSRRRDPRLKSANRRPAVQCGKPHAEAPCDRSPQAAASSVAGRPG
jgi:DNA-binding transcriptional ArsR family regulator